MIYLMLALSLTGNVILVWYIRKLLQKYWFDAEIRQKFTGMLEQYAESLNSFYKLEELYGEEIIKKAIIQTQFVIEACREFKEAIDTEANRQEEGEDEVIEGEVLNSEDNKDEEVIKLREGQKVTQSASNYKRVIAER